MTRIKALFGAAERNFWLALAGHADGNRWANLAGAEFILRLDGADPPECQKQEADVLTPDGRKGKLVLEASQQGSVRGGETRPRAIVTLPGGKRAEAALIGRDGPQYAPLPEPWPLFELYVGNRYYTEFLGRRPYYKTARTAAEAGQWLAWGLMAQAEPKRRGDWGPMIAGRGDHSVVAARFDKAAAAAARAA